MKAFDSGVTSSLLVMCTGAGKTICFGHVADRMLPRGRVMVLVHRQELLDQAAEKMLRVTGHVAAIEKAEQFSDEDSLHGKPPLVIASVQSLNSGDDDMRRLHRFDPADFALLIADECHHGVSTTWKRCIDHFKQNSDLRVLGVTATPDRADECGLAEIFEHVAYDYQLPRAINDGYLVPIHQRRVFIEGLEFAKIKTVAGDFDQGELEAAMLAEKPLHGVTHATIEQACNLELGYLESIRDNNNRADMLYERLGGAMARKTLLFTVSVSHAERVAEIINRWIPGSAVSISGKTPKLERERIVNAFADGAIRFLANCAVALEGFDEPSIEIVSMARPTKSRTIYAQAVGRATRPAGHIAGDLGKAADASARRAMISASNKPHCEILDFVGNSGRHKLVCTADLLGTAQTPEEVTERAAGLAEAGEVDMSEALEQAEEELKQSREAQSLVEELEAERSDRDDEMRLTAEASRRVNVVATAKYQTQDVDGFDNSQLEPEVKGAGGATPKQIDFLVKLGVDRATAAGYGRRQAGAVITSQKQKRGTNGQRWKLKTLGFTPSEIDGMNFEQCIRTIDESTRGAA